MLVQCFSSVNCFVCTKSYYCVMRAVNNITQAYDSPLLRIKQSKSDYTDVLKHLRATTSIEVLRSQQRLSQCVYWDSSRYSCTTVGLRQNTLAGDSEQRRIQKFLIRGDKHGDQGTHCRDSSLNGDARVSPLGKLLKLFYANHTASLAGL